MATILFPSEAEDLLGVFEEIYLEMRTTLALKVETSDTDLAKVLKKLADKLEQTGTQMQNVTRQCANCGRDFQPRTGKQSVCSRACAEMQARSRAASKRKNGKGAAETVLVEAVQ